MIAFNTEGISSKRFDSANLISTNRKVVRRVKDLEPVLYDASSCKGLDSELPVYTIHRDLYSDNDQRSTLLDNGLRYDVTEMFPLMLGEEYAKTFGHDHLSWQGAWSHPEIFEIIQGEARFLIQTYRGEDVVSVSFVVAREGDVILIPPGCGHSMINVSSDRLIVGNLISQNCVQTYRRFTERKGGAYFLVRGGKLVENRNYRSLPEARIVGAESPEFIEKESGLLASFRRRPELFKFLNDQNGSMKARAILSD
jgi:glucose-6-phosphate isomerase